MPVPFCGTTDRPKGRARCPSHATAIPAPPCGEGPEVPPAGLSPEAQLNAFLHTLGRQQRSWSWIAANLSVLRTAFDKLGGLRLTAAWRTPRRPQRLPEVLSPEEARRVLAAGATLRDQLLLEQLHARLTPPAVQSPADRLPPAAAEPAARPAAPAAQQAEPLFAKPLSVNGLALPFPVDAPGPLARAVEFCRLLRTRVRKGFLAFRRAARTG